MTWRRQGEGKPVTRLGQECLWQGPREEGSSPSIPALPPSAIFGRDALGGGDLGAELQKLGAGAEQMCPGLLGRVCATQGASAGLAAPPRSSSWSYS